MNSATNAERTIQHIQDTFCLVENDLHKFYQAFCHLAKGQGTNNVAKGPLSVAAADKSSSTKKQRKKREKKKPASPTTSSSNAIMQHSTRSWEANSVTLSFTNFFTAFQPTQRCNNGGYLDAIFDLCGK